MKTDPKILAFTKAILAVFKENKKNPMILENESMPRGYFGQIREILPDEFSWPPRDTGLSKLFNENKQVILNILKADKQPTSEEPTQISSVQTEEPERYEQVTKPICSGDIPIQTIEQIVEKIIDRRLLELKEGLLTKQYGLELAPARSFIKGKRGKQENRKSRPIATSIDSELYKRFQADRKRYGVSESFMLDSIIWHFYQKPKLSYELDPLRLEPDED
jgi:hypothetical protein